MYTRILRRMRVRQRRENRHCTQFTGVISPVCVTSFLTETRRRLPRRTSRGFAIASHRQGLQVRPTLGRRVPTSTPHSFVPKRSWASSALTVSPSSNCRSLCSKSSSARFERRVPFTASRRASRMNSERELYPCSCHRSSKFARKSFGSRRFTFRILVESVGGPR